MATLLHLAVTATTATATTTTTTKPNILMILSDDVGWGNVGWNRAIKSNEVATPALDNLVAVGIELTQFYSFKYCSPTRSALQSGRNPIHVNVINQLNFYNPNATDTSGYSGIALNMTTLPEKMRAAGYIPHAVGKWDVGGSTLRQTPAGRGYESWLGYWSACNDYWNMEPKCGPSTCTVDGATHTMIDFWEQDRSVPSSDPNTGAPYLSRPAKAVTNAKNCTQTDQYKGCEFEDDVLLSRAQKIVLEHAADPSPTKAPLFLYWATHAAHGPREVPQATLDNFSFIDWKARKTYAGLINHLDTLVGDMVATLKHTKTWDNTLIVWCSDNGGDDAANNYPQRGAKFSNWNGGIHVAAFVSGGAIPPARRGIKIDGLATAWDLYATLSVAAGLSEAEAVSDASAAKAGLPAIDSISQWEYWMSSSGEGESDAASGAVLPPRTELAVGGEVGDENGGVSGVRWKGPSASNTGVEAIIMSVTTTNAATTTATTTTLYKLMVGTFHFAMWTGPQWPNKTSTSFNANHSHWDVTADCRKTGCLYDLTNDPNEHTDLAVNGGHSALVAKMRARLEAMNATVFTPDRGTNKANTLGCTVGVKEYNGYFGPFLDLPDEREE